MAQNKSVYIYFILLGIWSSVYADIIAGKVVSIQDGDTLTLLDISNTRYRIRIAGIDTPEKGQPFGEQAKQSLAKLVYEKMVVTDCYKKDRYGRLLCTIQVDGVDMGLAQLNAGYAWWYKKYSNEQPQQQAHDYELAETKAKASSMGLWVQKDPLAPWDWRKDKLNRSLDSSVEKKDGQ